MELRVLRYFLAVAKELNISKAGEELYVTQPTLSRQIMELEDELGVKLFIRGSRKLILTEDGMLLRKRAEEILELASKTKSELTSSKSAVSGDIYIGGGETDGIRILAKVAHELQKKHSNICLHIHSGDADDITEKLDKGLIDFGLLIEPVNLKKYVALQLPAVDSWGVLMRKDSPLASNKAIRPEDLWNSRLILSRQSLAGEQISKWIKKDYSKLNIVAVYNLIYNASRMVEEGLGYALTLDKLVNITGNSELKFTALEPKLEAGLVVVWKRYQVFSKASTIFLQKLEEFISRKDRGY